MTIEQRANALYEATQRYQGQNLEVSVWLPTERRYAALASPNDPNTIACELRRLFTGE